MAYTDTQRTTGLLQANSVTIAAVLDMSQPCAGGPGIVETPRIAAARAGPSRRCPVATGAAANCHTEADSHVRV